MNSPIARFGLGGMGGLLPILASLVVIDLSAIASMVDHSGAISAGMCVGYAVRVIGLFIIGGTMAVVTTEARTPFSLIQVGIAAPALITSLMTGAALSPDLKKTAQLFSIVSDAYAADLPEARPVVLASSFFDDVFKGLTPGFGKSIEGKIGEVQKDLGKAADPTVRTYNFKDKTTNSCVSLTAKKDELSTTKVQQMFPSARYEEVVDCAAIKPAP